MPHDHERRDFARRLRADMTDAERFVWSKLRRRQLGGHRFRRQHPSGPFVIDFACLECRVAIELDGGQHAERAEYDTARTTWLMGHGYTVLRSWNHEVFEDWDTLERQIWDVLQQKTPHPPSAPQTPTSPARGEVENQNALFASPLAGEIGSGSKATEPGGG